MLSFIASLLILALAPVIYALAQRFQRHWRATQSILAMFVGTLVVVHILPESILIGGDMCVGFAFVGLFLPSILERIWSKGARQIHFVSVTVGIVGLGVHGAMDGAALAAKLSASQALPMAVILHRLPAAVLLWSLFVRKGQRQAWAVLLGLGLATSIGYFAGQEIMQAGSHHRFLAFFQALVSGALLHTVFDSHSGFDEEHNHHH